MTVTRINETALRVEVPGWQQAHWLRQRLLEQAPAGVVDVVPGLQSLLVIFEPQVCDVHALKRLLAHPLAAPSRVIGRCHCIPVHYQGADLARVAELTGLGVSAVVRLHCSVTYTVAMLGFSPGFPYLAGLPSALHLPRRAVPRTRVASGSVAIASDMTAIYPHQSAGGWHLIGHTDSVLFDATLPQPALLLPGDQVRFVEAP